MTNWTFLGALAAGVVGASAALALPIAKAASVEGTILARMVCDETGRCWRQPSPEEDIIGGVLGGIEGRSGYRGRDYDDRDSRRRDRDDDHGFDDRRDSR